jgi:membrane protein implicated in regulation of membrane protease activity
MDIQEIIAFVILALAVAYLLRKYFLRRKKQLVIAADDCGCH